MRSAWALAAALLLTLQGCILFPSYMGRLEKYTPAVVAAESGDIAAMRAELDRNAKLIKYREWGGATLLHDAVNRDQEAMAAFLLSRGARVNARDKEGLTPLHFAATDGRVPIIRLLLGHGAKRDAIDRAGRTPLDRAVEWEQMENANFLRSQGARRAAECGAAGARARPPARRALC